MDLKVGWIKGDVAAPVHYKLKIKNYSRLLRIVKNIGHDFFKSTHLATGGYNWVMWVYPEGNQRNGEGSNLSLYVEMLDELQSGVGVTAELSFYIYNFHTRDYLRIRADERARFSAIKRKCGLHKAISLEDFTDPRNGFLVDDCCILGTEIIIVNLDNEALMTMIKDVTPTHTLGWYLVAYPKGHMSQQNESLSLYLCLADREAVKRGQKLYVEFELRLMDHLPGDHLTRTLSRCFSEELGVEWGFSDFVSLTYLGDFSKYVRQNVMTIEVKFTSMLVLNNSS